eukprot:TRINITY_DN33050_c0_g1_i1.p1 TRINITY_DN33050_c0_g1~~TRINITY_DN33050_c0_g1_i1.p1  ORF type:complete len:451 (+),score=32.69 TRINITY_DN33050_c0_g1_i1:150-1502(+)
MLGVGAPSLPGLFVQLLSIPQTGNPTCHSPGAYPFHITPLSSLIPPQEASGNCNSRRSSRSISSASPKWLDSSSFLFTPPRLHDYLLSSHSQVSRRGLKALDVWESLRPRKGTTKVSMTTFTSTAPSASAMSSPLEDCRACPPEFVDFAHQLADIAREVVPPYFRVPVDIDTKTDSSPVTIADRELEERMRAAIEARFPSHFILGEEGGVSGGVREGLSATMEAGNSSANEVESSNTDLKSLPNPNFIWVLDPIDGTASFITGKPLFGVLISLLYNGIPILGMIEQPILKERWVGVLVSADTGSASAPTEYRTTFNGKVVRTRGCPSLSESYLYSTSPHLFSGASAEAFERVRTQVKRTSYGCDCYAFGLLSLGFVDLVIEHGMKPWDYFALIPVVEGAGGKFTDWEGKPLRLASLNPDDWVGECLAVGDPGLHLRAIEALAWKKSANML